MLSDGLRKIRELVENGMPLRFALEKLPDGEREDTIWILAHELDNDHLPSILQALDTAIDFISSCEVKKSAEGYSESQLFQGILNPTGQHDHCSKARRMKKYLEKK